jgi:hypothetical protein
MNARQQRLVELQLDEMMQSRYEVPRAKQFVVIAQSIARNAQPTALINDLRQTGLPYTVDFAKAFQEAQSLDEAWLGIGRDTGDAFIASLAQGSLLEQIAKYARVLPEGIHNVVVASGFTADVAAESQPKIVKHVDTVGMEWEPVKVAAVVVVTNELMRVRGRTATNLFETELRNATLAAVNEAVLNRFPNTVSVLSTGTALGDLTAGLAASEPSKGYVVAASPEAARELALQSDGRMGINGGTFVEGVEVVVVDGTSSGGLKVIAASRSMIKDYGIAVRNAGHASVMLSDTPTSPGQLTSLFQTDSQGLLVERTFVFESAAAVVEVG